MKKVLFIAALFHTVYSFSQKIEKNEIDKFTGVHHISTSMEKISVGFGCSLIKNDSVLSLFIMYDCGSNVLTVTKDSEFLIRLTNAEILKLKVPQTAISRVVYGGSYLDMTFQLDSMLLNKLKLNSIESVRFDTSKFYITRNVSKNDSKKLQALFNLIQ
ncbi:MAG: hypothetical protein WCH76_07555 [Candidatus Riflemargulisbacteria bacterium]